ncbi:sporulation integral membrane protein YlbJ, partial [Clostridioides difficile]
MTASKLFDGFIEDAREKIIAEPFNENILLKQHEAIRSAREGFSIWSNVLVPSLLPFIIGANLIVDLKIVDIIG